MLCRLYWRMLGLRLYAFGPLARNPRDDGGEQIQQALQLARNTLQATDAYQFVAIGPPTPSTARAPSPLSSVPPSPSTKRPAASIPSPTVSP